MSDLSGEVSSPATQIDETGQSSASLQAEDLGKLSANLFDPDSTSNQFGRYGLTFSPDSRNNQFGAGNPFRPDSPDNLYGREWRIEGR